MSWVIMRIVRPKAHLIQQEIVQQATGFVVQSGIRFVEQQNVRFVECGAGDGQPLEHAARERADRVPLSGKEADLAQRSHDPILRVVDPVDSREEGQVFGRSQVMVEQGLVRNQTDMTANAFGFGTAAATRRR